MNKLFESVFELANLITPGYAFVTNDKGQLRQYNANDFGILPDNIIDVLDKESLRDTQIQRLLR